MCVYFLIRSINLYKNKDVILYFYNFIHNMNFFVGISSNYSDDQPYSWTFPPFHPKSEIYKNSKVCITKGNPFPQSNLVCPVEIKLQPGGTLPDIESTYEAIKFLQKSHTTRIPFFLAVGFHKPHIPLKYPKHFKSK